jgi:hypothetical protein
MGGGRGKRFSKAYKPGSDIAAKKVERRKVEGTLITPTMQQAQFARSRRGAYATRGQSLGAGGQILGAGPMELADVTESLGIDEAFSPLGQKEFESVTQYTGGKTFEQVKMEKKPSSRGFSGSSARDRWHKRQRNVRAAATKAYKQYQANYKQSKAYKDAQQRQKGQTV